MKTGKRMGKAERKEGRSQRSPPVVASDGKEENGQGKSQRIRKGMVPKGVNIKIFCVFRADSL